MKKRIVYVVLLVVLVVLTSCTNQASKEVKEENTKAKEVKTDKNEKEESEKKKEKVTHKAYEYDIFVDTVEAKDVINYKKLDIPKYLNDSKVACSNIMDKKRLLLFLYPKTDADYLTKHRELGIYNLDTKKYETLLVFKKDETHQLVAINDKYMMLRLSSDNWRHTTLNVYSFKEKKIKEIFKYSINKENDSIVVDNNNNIVLKNDTVWFDDYYMDENGETRVNLYTYDCNTGEVKLFKKDAQNPMEYKGSIIYFVKNSEDKYRTFESIENKKVLDVKEELSAIVGFGDNLFCIENKYKGDEKQGKDSQIKNLTTQELVLFTTRSIGSLEISDRFVTWHDFDYNTACMYSIKDNQIIAFTDLPSGINVFYLKDNFGILMNRRDESAEPEYYYFE